VLTAEAWVEVGGKMYVVGDANDKPGPANKIESGYETTASGQKRKIFDRRVGWGRMARSVAPNGDMGPIFWLIDDPPAPMEGFPQYPSARDPQYRDLASQINNYLANPLHMPAWDFLKHTDRPRSVDDHEMCEPTAYRRPDGVLVILSRDCGPHQSHQIYASLSRDSGKSWTTPSRTNIPDSPSKSVAGTLPNGRIYLIGNQIPGKSHNNFRDPLVISLSSDGKTFAWAAAMLHGTPPLRYPGHAKNRGFQYPSAMVVGASLWVIYSINKEDVAISRVPLSILGSEQRK
ncbi:MAG TPA: exo-alpha-sialidase, partial [Terriglobia bacterium]|nr:exo-alpha-sialidase [Terriglobia bacterium]